MRLERAVGQACRVPHIGHAPAEDFGIGEPSVRVDRHLRHGGTGLAAGGRTARHRAADVERSVHAARVLRLFQCGDTECAAYPLQVEIRDAPFGRIADRGRLDAKLRRRPVRERSPLDRRLIQLHVALDDAGGPAHVIIRDREPRRDVGRAGGRRQPAEVDAVGPSAQVERQRTAARRRDDEAASGRRPSVSGSASIELNARPGDRAAEANVSCVVPGSRHARAVEDE